MSTVRLEALARGAVEIPLQPASYDIWDKKYRLKSKKGEPVDASIDHTYQRVAKALSDAEGAPEKRKYWSERFLWALRRGAIPAGRVTSNAGAFEHKPATSTINCTVSGTIEDSMDGILDKVHEAGLTLKAGCGIGYEFSTLRPRGAYVSGAGAYTSGPMSFMDIYDKMCFTVSSAGGRRGAQMGTFDVSHPDVKEFIRAKRENGRLRHICDRGIEPAAAARAHHLARGCEAVLGDEHVGRLRQAGDAGEDRDHVAAQPVGLAAPVPVLVEIADGVGGGIGELEHRHDARAAIAARLDGQIALTGHVAQGGQHPPRPHEARVVPARLAGDEPDGMARARPVDALGDPLQLEVVGGEDLGHARGRRRAARVLEQHGVVEARTFLGGERERVGQAKRDQAAALRVPRRLALGQVERVGEGGHDLAHREGLRRRLGRGTKVCRHHRGYRPPPAPVHPSASDLRWGR